MRDRVDLFGMPRRRAIQPAFSLVELVIVVVIIGIIGAIAVPRLSGMGKNTGEVALAQNLVILTKAVEMYKVEHLGVPPATALQLTRFTDEEGNINNSRGYPFEYGPYLFKIPALTVGVNSGKTAITTAGSPGDDASAGWWIDSSTGDVRANAPDTDLTSTGKQVNSFAVSDILKN